MLGCGCLNACATSLTYAAMNVEPVPFRFAAGSCLVLPPPLLVVLELSLLLLLLPQAAAKTPSTATTAMSQRQRVEVRVIRRTLLEG